MGRGWGSGPSVPWDAGRLGGLGTPSLRPEALPRPGEGWGLARAGARLGRAASWATPVPETLGAPHCPWAGLR